MPDMPMFYRDPATGNVVTLGPDGSPIPYWGPPGQGIQPMLGLQQPPAPMMAPDVTQMGLEQGLGGGLQPPQAPYMPMSTPPTPPPVAPALAPPMPEAAPAPGSPAPPLARSPSPEDVALAQVGGERRPPRGMGEAFGMEVGDRAALAPTILKESALVDQAVQAQAAAQATEAKAEIPLRQQQADIARDAESKLIESNRIDAAQQQELIAKQQQAVEELASSRVDPGAFWRNTTTENKIAVGIGAVAAGFLALRGFGKGNPVLESIDRAITRDIDAQMANIDIKKAGLSARGNLLNQMLSVSQDQRQARDLAMMAGWKRVESQIDVAKAQAGSDAGKAKLDELGAAAKQRQAELRLKLDTDMSDRSATKMKTRAEISSLMASAEQARAGAEHSRAEAEKSRAEAVALKDKGKLAPAYGKLAEARTKYKPDAKDTNIVQNPLFSEGYHIVENDKDRQVVEKTSVAAEGMLDKLSQLNNLLKPGRVAPWSEREALIKGLEADLSNSLKEPGSGAVSEADAKANLAKISGGKSAWSSLAGPEVQRAVVQQLMKSTAKHMNSVLANSGVTDKVTSFDWKDKLAEEDPNAVPPAHEQALGVLSKMRPPSQVVADVQQSLSKSFGPGASPAPRELETATVKELTAQGQTLKNQFPKAQVIKEIHALRKYQDRPDSPEYANARRYATNVANKATEVITPEVLQMERDPELRKKYKTYFEGIQAYREALTLVNDALSSAASGVFQPEPKTQDELIKEGLQRFGGRRR